MIVGTQKTHADGICDLRQIAQSLRGQALVSLFSGERLNTARHILIVEDNPGDIRLMREALRGTEPGLQLLVAMDAEQACTLLKRQGEYADAPRPELIFLDFNLPKSGSRELLRSIKADEELCLIPVAVLTTSEADRDVRDAYELGANCYLRKPVDLESFFATIQSAAHFWLNVAYTAVPKSEAATSDSHLL